MTKVSLKPDVYWDGTYWVAELDHVSWSDMSSFDSWDRAIEHALWLGLNAGVWNLDRAD